MPICLTELKSNTPELVVEIGIANSLSPPFNSVVIALMVMARSFVVVDPPIVLPRILIVSPTAYPSPATCTVICVVVVEYAVPAAVNCTVILALAPELEH